MNTDISKLEAKISLEEKDLKKLQAEHSKSKSVQHKQSKGVDTDTAPKPAETPGTIITKMNLNRIEIQQLQSKIKSSEDSIKNLNELISHSKAEQDDNNKGIAKLKGKNLSKEDQELLETYRSSNELHKKLLKQNNKTLDERETLIIQLESQLAKSQKYQQTLADQYSKSKFAF